MLIKFYNYFPFVACEDGALYCLATTGDRSGCYGCTGSSGDVWSLFLTWREFLRGPLHKDYDFRHCLWKVSES